MSDALGFSQRVKYDKQGRPVELIDALDQRWLRRYDANGRLEETVAANGAATQYQYNAQGVPVRITDALGRTRSLLWDEQLRLVGEIGFDGIKTRYQYDDDERIVAIVDQDKRTTRYGYDAAGRVTAVQHADGSTVQLRYKPAGLLTHYIDSLGHTTEYRYDDGLSQPTARIDPLGHEMRYRYDSERNLIGLIKLHELDDLRQGRSQYHYDPAARLIRSEGLSPESFVHDPAGNLLGASAEAGRVEGDHLGTPRELTDTNGRIVWSARYRAYGNLALADVQEIDNPLRFQGQYYDQETGLHYNLNRYYDPNAGRFIHQDPIGLEGGANVYRYAPNPVNWIDPLGA
ncbi:RHS repeat domain-containing protein [Methylomonas albis]|uniref:RHS repeat domain-containing protein n=1 Tax=Methylomonas albis TaxID=1854563 RepID=UPI001E32F223|nr:RHS repeat-associated core domain-containing protein [Methylomonas albis]